MIPFTTLPIWHIIKFLHTDPITRIASIPDLIHSQPARHDKHGHVIPGRFDMALLNDGSGGNCGAKGAFCSHLHAQNFSWCWKQSRLQYCVHTCYIFVVFTGQIAWQVMTGKWLQSFAVTVMAGYEQLESQSWQFLKPLWLRMTGYDLSQPVIQ